MERIFVVTPEMLGLGWSRLFREALRRSVVYLLAATLFSSLSNGRWVISVSAALVGSAIDFALTFTVRIDRPSRLRLTDDSIGEGDGPIIRKDEIVALIEQNDSEPRGFEIVGRRKLSWLPKYRIFIPASVPEFNELRQLLSDWKNSGNLSRFDNC